MHLKALRARQQAQRQLEQLPAHPRAAAVEWLKDQVAAGRAGLDPYDESILIVQASNGERVWAYIALEVCGTILSYTDRGGERRLRAIVEADVRVELRLDEQDPPLMVDEPLASRAARDLVAADRFSLALTDPIRLVDPEPAAMQALRAARAAYDERRVH